MNFSIQNLFLNSKLSNPNQKVKNQFGLFGGIRNLILIVCIILSSVSCTKEDNSNLTHINDDQMQSGKSLADSIGYYHNVGLASYMENFAALGQRSIDYKLVRSEIMDSLNKVSSSSFPIDTLRMIADNSDSILISLGIATTTQLDLNELNLNLLFSHLESEHFITPTLATELRALNTLAYSGNVSNQQFLQRIDNLSQFNNGLNDIDVISAVQQTAYSSYDYWLDMDPAPRCDLCVIWADAAGAAYGLLLGPIGSIVEGALFSTLAYIQE